MLNDEGFYRPFAAIHRVTVQHCALYLAKETYSAALCVVPR